ncbi:glycosyltransferase family 10 domain-containing protein [Parabacteroides sp. FAFU027]|uniref:glycosyltransferase family 10 domain-containing protein n=1 Tax=Parabacteroides sp. FAFU027 TaxID=2922715 RepID=UPI001FAFC1A5|nr:glycosyltransferase family 10 [Parabacteroides sp. FAFU027]
MKDVRVFFTDFWPGFECENNFIFKILAQRYKVIIDNVNPEYLFFSCYGSRHFDYNSSIKVYYTGENIVPDFNICDYALGFHFIEFEDRYMRLPLYAIREEFRNLDSKFFDSEQWLNKKFCNFIYSNSVNADPIRLRFLNRLNSYKHVDCGGELNNNLGYRVANKLHFISNYKFTIAFENSSVSGYTTEKLVEPMSAQSIPIYWGNPKVDFDFNTDSLVWIRSEDDIERAVEEIIYLDNNVDAYRDKFLQPWFYQNPYLNWEDKLLGFLINIIEIKGAKGKSCSNYGRSKIYNETMQSFVKLEEINSIGQNYSILESLNKLYISTLFKSKIKAKLVLCKLSNTLLK